MASAAPGSRPVLSPYGEQAVAPSPVNRMVADFRAGFDVNLGVGYVEQPDRSAFLQ